MTSSLFALLCLSTRREVRREQADGESERTAWSTHNPRELVTWRSCHEKHVASAEAFDLTDEPTRGPRRRLVLIGDSLMESWLEQTYCHHNAKFRGASAVLRGALLQSHWPKPLVLGISSDHTQHLAWRLRHGELTPRIAANPHVLFVLLIGTNNLGGGHLPTDVSRAVEAIAQTLLNSTRGRVLVHGLLPRGDAAKRGGALAAAAGVAKPLCSFVPYIEAVNRALNASVLGGGWLSRLYGRRIHYADCGSAFTPPAQGLAAQPAGCGKRRAANEVRVDLMPDRIHPNAAGHAEWIKCLLPAIERTARRKYLGADG